jgi:hypothetical protein
MDENVLSCSKCGHTVKESAEACAYCGTAVSAGDQDLSADEETAGLEAQAAAPSLSGENESSQDLTMVTETAGKTEDPGVASEAETLDQIQPEDKPADKVDAAAETVPDLDNQLTDFDDNIDFQLPDDELIMEMDSDQTASAPETAVEEKPESSANSGPELKHDVPEGQDNIVELEQQAAESSAEVIPLADKVSGKAASDSVPELPETAVLEETAEDKSESETLGADILELVQDEASARETADTPDNSKKDDEELEAILLAPADEGQSSKQLSSDDSDIAEGTAESDDPIELAAPAVGDTGKSESTSEKGQDAAGADVIQKQAEQQATVEAGKVEKAGAEPSESKKKQKPAADDQALKKQKAALAKAKALKAKKLKLAKVQALKKKKLKLAKAQALKKQKAAQAGTETASKEVAAGSKSPQAVNSKKGITSMDANTKMLGLLKKYEGQAIGINYDNSAAIKEAQLVEANDEFFSVFVKDKELSYNHPLKTILTIIEGQDGVETGESEQKEKFKAVVKVYPLVLF